jgi:hypothetical protein
MARIAFIFGSNGSPAGNQLKYALRDVERMRAAFANDRCGFHVHVAPPGSNPYQLQEQLDTLAASCVLDDVFLVYFSGHGAIEGGELYLELDGTTAQLFPTAFASRRLLDPFRMCQASNKLLILDCCHAGAAVGGVKDSRSLPVAELLPTRSHLVLFAGDRLEKAREFEDLHGSFLAHAIEKALASPAARGVTLSQLMESLRSDAVIHNRKRSADNRVPVPYLFGEQKGDYPIARPDSQTVMVSFTKNEEPDISLLLRTFEPFEKWTSHRIGCDLPITIEFPEFIRARMATLLRMVKNDEWPRPDIMSEEAKTQTKKFIEVEVPCFKKEMSTGVRGILSVVTAELREPDSILEPSDRDQILRFYLGSKMLTLIRNVISHHFIGEQSEHWVREYAHLETSWTKQIISGLTALYQHEHSDVLFWADADIELDHSLRRIDVPDRFIGRDLNQASKEEVLTILAPQLTPEDEAGTNYLYYLISDMRQKRLELIERNESFTDMTNFGLRGAGTPSMLSRLARKVAEFIVRQASAVKDERKRRVLIGEEINRFDFLPNLRKEVEKVTSSLPMPARDDTTAPAVRESRQKSDRKQPRT